MIKVTGYIKSGREWVKRARDATTGRFGEPTTPLADGPFIDLLIGRHSPIEEMEFWFDCIAPDRVMDHIVRHKEIGKYVTSSRPDRTTTLDAPEGHRNLSLCINAKRLIEIAWVRDCNAAWFETRELMDAIRDEVKRLDSTVGVFLAPSCVWFGVCVEPVCKCNYITTEDWKKSRTAFTDLTTWRKLTHNCGRC